MSSLPRPWAAWALAGVLTAAPASADQPWEPPTGAAGASLVAGPWQVGWADFHLAPTGPLSQAADLTLRVVGLAPTPEIRGFWAVAVPGFTRFRADGGLLTFTWARLEASGAEWSTTPDLSLGFLAAGGRGRLGFDLGLPLGSWAADHQAVWVRWGPWTAAAGLAEARAQAALSFWLYTPWSFHFTTRAGWVGLAGRWAGRWGPWGAGVDSGAALIFPGAWEGRFTRQTLGSPAETQPWPDIPWPRALAALHPWVGAGLGGTWEARAGRWLPWVVPGASSSSPSAPGTPGARALPWGDPRFWLDGLDLGLTARW